jgi:meso-butanediol dehydrogenase/(S,S)-butanediol dehydrogenase/diacetyl reductase
MLKNKVILVTGATSGMGAATARMLAGQGAKVMLFGRDEIRAGTVLKSIADAGGVADIFLGDITESSAADSAVAQVLDRFGRLDGLVNAAGMIYRGTADQTDDENWRISMATNVDGTFFMSRAAVRVMSNGGSIVNFASTCGLVGVAGLTAYCATKGAVVQLTRAMALDHAADNIRINSVCPGAVDTPMLISGRKGSGESKDDIYSRNIANIPQRRIPAPEEVANVVAFLCSDQSLHITGTNIPVDGGYTAK